MIVKVGITGTKEGATLRQLALLKGWLKKVKSLSHGDCVGVDEQAHYIAVRLGLQIYIHPPIKETYRAWCFSKSIFKKKTNKIELFEHKDYLERNHDIVDTTDLLIAVPKAFEEELRSGTWATVRYARKQGKQVCIIWPDGTYKDEPIERKDLE